MVEEDRSDSESDGSFEKSSSTDFESDSDGGEAGVSEYEKQRLLRIKENKARLQALGLPSLVSSLMSSIRTQPKRKEKEKKEDDDEYRPSDREAESSSSSDDDTEEEKSKSRDQGSSGSRRASDRRGKNKNSLRTEKAKKKAPVQKHVDESGFIDDEDAIRQAIALSLGEDSAIDRPPENFGAHEADVDHERKGRGLNQEDSKRKKRKMASNRVQMTEDEVIIHFFQFDEAGKGNITVRDLRRIAIAHDFTWTDKEMIEMIHSFDSDGDGKLTLDDFRKIIDRCNMIKRS